METGELVLAILTFMAILVALGIGVANIVQTKQIQEGERRERLLNEIIEWAKTVKGTGLGIDVTDIAKLKSEDEKRDYSRALVSYKIGSFKKVRGDGTLIRGIVRRFFNQALQQAVGTLIKDLDNHIELNEEFLKLLLKPGTPKPAWADFKKSVAHIVATNGISNIINTAAVIIKHKNRKLNNSADKVIEKATELMSE